MCVWHLCLSKKLKRGQDLCALPLDPQLQYRKFLASSDVEFLKSFLLFISIEEIDKDKKRSIRRSTIGKDRQKFLGKLPAASIFKSADPIRSSVLLIFIESLSLVREESKICQYDFWEEEGLSMTSF